MRFERSIEGAGRSYADDTDHHAGWTEGRTEVENRFRGMTVVMVEEAGVAPEGLVVAFDEVSKERSAISAA
jgi:hypothetical protein